MGIFILLLLHVVLFAVIIKAFTKDSRSSGYYGRYARDYDDVFYDDFDDYSDSETRASRGDRDYFSDDPADDYNSYYAQVADDAMMGDRDAMDAMYGEFGEAEW